MADLISKLKTVALVGGAALLVVACGEKAEAPSTDVSVTTTETAPAADAMAAPAADAAAADAMAAPAADAMAAPAADAMAAPAADAATTDVTVTTTETK